MDLDARRIEERDVSQELADDLLCGAVQIGEFIFGPGKKNSRRKVYYLAECTKLPVFRLGSVLCARRSVLLRWIAGQESRVKGSAGEGPFTVVEGAGNFGRGGAQ